MRYCPQNFRKPSSRKDAEAKNRFPHMVFDSVWSTCKDTLEGLSIRHIQSIVDKFDCVFFVRPCSSQAAHEKNMPVDMQIKTVDSRARHSSNRQIQRSFNTVDVSKAVESKGRTGEKSLYSHPWSLNTVDPENPSDSHMVLRVSSEQ